LQESEKKKKKHLSMAYCEVLICF